MLMAGLACAYRLLITSVNAPYPYLLPSSTAYNMAKAAMEALTQNLASGLAKHRINCNAIRPGWILTGAPRIGGCLSIWHVPST